MSNYWEQIEVISWTQLLLNSYEMLLGKALLERLDKPLLEAKNLFFAPFIVLSHDTQTSPIFNYGNQAALQLWEVDWDTLTKMPSVQTVAPPDIEEEKTRAQMLKKVAEQGYITGYEGIRINSRGKLMRISEVTVWNIMDLSGCYCGQAATYNKWAFL
jgi:hypothetical protein